MHAPEGHDGVWAVLRGQDDLRAALAGGGPRVAYERALVERQAGAEAFTVPAYCAACRGATELEVDFLYAAGRTPNWRERLVCPGCGLNNRQRFTAALLAALRPEATYLQEQVTAFHGWAAGELPGVVGSEYLGDGMASGTVVDGVRHEDALALSFADAAFDVIVSNDVLEHVPDAPRAFAEAARVLRPGGLLVFSVPFHADRDAVVRRAEIRDGELVHLDEPQYHGNPVGDGRSLVFYDYGWDLLALCRDAGFADAWAIGYWSAMLGHLGGGLQTVFAARR